MSYVEDLVPEFDIEAYKDAVVGPLIMWAVVQVLWLILTFVDDLVGTPMAGGIALELNLLFGAWVGMNMARAGSNSGDAAIAGLVTGIVAGILWLILFPVIDPLDLGVEVGDVWPVIIIIALQHVVGSITIAGIMGGDMEDAPDKPAKKPAKKKPAKKAAKKAAKSDE